MGSPHACQDVGAAAEEARWKINPSVLYLPCGWVGVKARYRKSHHGCSRPAHGRVFGLSCFTTARDQHGKSPMRSRSSIGSLTSIPTRNDRARRAVVHLLLQRPTGPSLRRRLAAATPPALRVRTSSSSWCARMPAGSRFSHLGIIVSPPAARNAGGQGQEEASRQPLRQVPRQEVLCDSGGGRPRHLLQVRSHGHRQPGLGHGLLCHDAGR